MEFPKRASRVFVFLVGETSPPRLIRPTPAGLEALSGDVSCMVVKMVITVWKTIRIHRRVRSRLHCQSERSHEELKDGLEGPSRPLDDDRGLGNLIHFLVVRGIPILRV